MECWPCKNVHSVIDLTGFKGEISYKTSSPFIVKTSQKHVDFSLLQQTYIKHKNILNFENNGIKSSNSTLKSLDDVFRSQIHEKTHTSWRINKMNSARIVRELFPRPGFLSEWSGQSVERFVMLDGPKAGQYLLPNMECSYIFVIQGAGERTIILKPSRECQQNCKTVSVILKTSYVRKLFLFLKVE